MYLYNLLKVKQNSSKEEIKKSYRKLAKLFHPDMNDEVGSEIKFMSIKKAYDFLMNSDLRHKYDAALIFVNDETFQYVNQQIKRKYLEAYKLDFLLSIDLKKSINYNRQSIIVSLIYDYCIVSGYSEGVVLKLIEDYENELKMNSNYSQHSLVEVKATSINGSMKYSNVIKFKYATYLLLALVVVVSLIYFSQNFLSKPDKPIDVPQTKTISLVSYPSQIDGVYVVNGGSMIYTWRFHEDGSIDTEIYFPKTGEKTIGKASRTYSHVKNDLFYIYESGTLSSKARIFSGKFYLINSSVSDEDALKYTDDYPGLLQK